MGKAAKTPRSKTFYENLTSLKEQYFTTNFLKRLIYDVDCLLPVSIILILGDILLSVIIVEKVNYTEIDWKAYMQEVEGVLNGTYDYSKLKGDTGPLVYPAGFVYLYSILYYLTDHGTNIKVAQYIFVGLYISLLILVFRLYIKSKKVPPYVLILMCFTSYRIHSIFMLRLFNDPFAVFLAYAALNFFVDGYWSLGSIFFSLAVSVKMNILLFAPALLLAFLHCLGVRDTIIQLGICAIIQVLLGSPFLLENPFAYMKGSFDIGRVFLYEWTVNWRFLPEDIFVNQVFHVTLLVIHVSLLALFYKQSGLYLQAFGRLKELESQVQKQLKKRTEKIDMGSTSQLFIYPMFLANFIGVACSRSLHYQFYIWYYHSLPYLLWCTSLSLRWKLLTLGLIELSWNTFPSTDISSALLHICHLAIIVSLYLKQNPEKKS